MNKNKIIMALVMVLSCVALTASARPHGGHGGFGGGPAPMHHGGGHHGHSFWGHGGSHFWPGFVGGVVGGVISSRPYYSTPIVSTPVYTTPIVSTPIVTTPVVTTPVVSTPTYVTQQVWVEGRYVDQVQANGTVIRVWQPGHYETRKVLVQ